MTTPHATLSDRLYDVIARRHGFSVLDSTRLEEYRGLTPRERGVAGRDLPDVVAEGGGRVAVLHEMAARSGEGVAAGEARDLAEEVPPELAAWLATNTPAAGFGVDEFILSGWPHLEEAYRVGERVLPRLAPATV